MEAHRLLLQHILPLKIFAVIKAYPSHFISHLVYTRRFRNQHIGGEKGLMTVADFLENVDLKALGLGESEKKVMRFVMSSSFLFSYCTSSVTRAYVSPTSTTDLTPIPVHRAALDSQASPVSPEGAFDGASRNKSMPLLVLIIKLFLVLLPLDGG
jgi:hypothetical protein